MAALSITAASVAAGIDAVKVLGTAGGTITAGQCVCINTSSLVVACDSNSASLATPIGIALHGSLSGQPITYQTAGTITIGATVAVGMTYIAGATAGEINPISDLTTGWYLGYLGYANTTTTITMMLKATGVVSA